MSPARGSRLRGPQLYSPEDIECLDRVARRARSGLSALLELCRPGTTPASIAEACAKNTRLAHERTPMMGISNRKGEVFGEPCAISVDDAVAHARSHRRSLRRGQLVSVDLMLSVGGWCADVADTVVVGGVGHPLLEALDGVWEAGLAAMAPGRDWAEVARAMADAAESSGVRLVRGLAGHGIGRACHELPVLPLTPGDADPPIALRPGMVLTLEPAVTTGSGEIVEAGDGWALRTADGHPAAVRERMVAVGVGRVRVLGGSDGDSASGLG
ncbi:MAG: methionyl aminopeptidase [Planctomycetota bacterium]